MKIEIWSDVMCPFCYIGKRKFEHALSQFEGKATVEVVWKSFQLSPGIKTDPQKNVNQFLAEHKGISIEQAQQMHDHVTKMAATVGLAYNFDKAVVANSFYAHCFLHFAKKHGKQNDAEELLFRSYFTDGKNTGDVDVLAELCTLLNLDAETVKRSMQNEEFAKDVKTDIDEAAQLGINAVPFFVFNRKFAISGAQNEQVFLQALNKAAEK